MCLGNRLDPPILSQDELIRRMGLEAELWGLCLMVYHRVIYHSLGLEVYR